jgi:hypothetical protein
VATAYLAVDRHKLDDKQPLLYRTHDFGKTWTRIVSGIPMGAYVRSVREDPTQAGLLYAATERGVYFSNDDGAHWQSLQLNLPPTPIHDLAIKDGDLIAATHGRSFWILDDLSPVRQAASVHTERAAILLTPAPAVRRHVPDQVERRLPVGDNPPAGAVIDYYLQKAPAENEEVVLEFLDASGQVLKHFSNRRPKDAYAQPAEWTDREEPVDTIPAAAGANRFAWNMHREDPTVLPGAVYGEGLPRGPLLRPGQYQVRLTVAGQSQVVPFVVVLDPRLQGQVSAADLLALEHLALETWQDIDALHRAVNQIRSVRAKLQTLQKWSADEASAQAVVQAGEEKGVYSIAYNSDMSKYGPKTCLTGVTMVWDQYYINAVKAGIAGTWKSDDVWGGIGAGMVKLAKMNPVVPAEVAAGQRDLRLVPEQTVELLHLALQTYLSVLGE